MSCVMPQHLTAVARSVYELLCMGTFRMGPNQRQFCWRPQQARALLCDMWSFYNKHRGDKREAKFYCIGLIALQQGDRGVNVIDGQQRLVTLWVVLALLKDLLRKAASSSEDCKRVLEFCFVPRLLQAMGRDAMRSAKFCFDSDSDMQRAFNAVQASEASGALESVPRKALTDPHLKMSGEMAFLAVFHALQGDINDMLHDDISALEGFTECVVEQGAPPSLNLSRAPSHPTRSLRKCDNIGGLSRRCVQSFPQHQHAGCAHHGVR